MVDSSPAALLQALHAERGVVALVGAGGKKTTMYALAALHPGRVALSSTSHMYRYREDAVDQVITPSPQATSVDAAARVVAFAGATDTPQRVGGLAADALHALWQRGGFDLMLIKADGARARLIKAPAGHEPLIPAFADTVIAVVSAAALGRRLDSGIAHRPELAAEVMQTTTTTPLTPVHLARLLAAPAGLMKGVGQATVVPLINMVDDAARLAQARVAARAALAASTRFDTVVLASMKTPRLVEIVRR